MAAVVGTAIERASKVLTGDLVVVNGKVYRKIGKGKKAVFEPIDVSLHVNPMTLGAGLVGFAVAGFFAVGRVAVPSPLGGEVVLYEGPFRDWLFNRKHKGTVGDALNRMLGAVGILEIAVSGFQRGEIGYVQMANTIFDAKGETKYVLPLPDGPFLISEGNYVLSPRPSFLTWTPEYIEIEIIKDERTIASFVAR